MDKSPDWSLIEAFLAVAEAGSLSGAARTLGASQPTLGRRIAQLEAELGVELFHRRPRGLDLTESGLALVPDAEIARDAMNRIAIAAAGEQTQLSGTVRITASEMLSYFHLPAIISGLRRTEPEIEIELVPSDITSNLLFREADIAIRMYRPTQLDLVTQHIGDLAIAMYASREYLARRGTPAGPADLARHDLVGFDGNEAILDGYRTAGLPASRDWFGVRCDHNLAYWALVRVGCGIGFAQRNIADRYDDVVEIELGFPLPPLPVWLTAHEAMRRSPRIRRVWDVLRVELGAICAAA